MVCHYQREGPPIDPKFAPRPHRARTVARAPSKGAAIPCPLWQSSQYRRPVQRRSHAARTPPPRMESV